MKVYFFTGAGISAESGISTFRDANGLWENNKIEEICNINTWEANKEKVFKFYSERRIQLGNVQPNLIHKTISELQNKYGNNNIIVMTQNVDDLLERAGCSEVLHLHGNLKEIKCLDCHRTFDISYKNFTEKETCKYCKSNNIKPNIIFFGEYAPNYHFMKRNFRNINKEDIVIVMGTLGNVIGISRYINFCDSKLKILNNLEYSEYINERDFNYIFYEKGTEAIIKIKKLIENHLK